jgi:glycosyltransferase involved in cell wall biosynthesis
MRVLHTLSSGTLGGSEKVMAAICGEQIERGYDVWASIPELCPIEPELVRFGVSIMRTRLKTPFCLWKLGMRVREMGFDIVHGHLTGGTHAANVISLLSNVPVVVHGHVCSTDYNYKLAAHRGMMVAVSQSVARHYAGRCGIRPDRIAVVHNGSNIAQTPGATIDRKTSRLALSTELGLPGAARFVVITGRLVPLKGQDVLLEAFAKLASDHANLHVVLAGPHEDPVFADELRRIAARHGLSGRVHLLGLRTDVAQLLKAALVAVVPSRHEAFPLGVVEPILLGVPVVASRVGGIPEVLPGEPYPYLVPPDDVGALAEAIGRVLVAPEEATRAARSAAIAVRERYSVESMVNGIDAVYRSLLPNIAAEAMQT